MVFFPGKLVQEELVRQITTHDTWVGLKAITDTHPLFPLPLFYQQSEHLYGSRWLVWWDNPDPHLWGVWIFGDHAYTCFGWCIFPFISKTDHENTKRHSSLLWVPTHSWCRRKSISSALESISPYRMIIIYIVYLSFDMRSLIWLRNNYGLKLNGASAVLPGKNISLPCKNQDHKIHRD